MHPILLQEAKLLVSQLQKEGKRISFAESCTGGYLAACLTSIDGSSQVFRGSWVCYHAETKQKQLGVAAELIENEGVVSAAVAASMAEGALRESGADYALAITGNAGPTAEKGAAEVGTAYIALARAGEKTQVELFERMGLDRLIWRDEAAIACFEMLLKETKSV